MCLIKGVKRVIRIPAIGLGASLVLLHLVKEWLPQRPLLSNLHLNYNVTFTKCASGSGVFGHEI